MNVFIHICGAGMGLLAFSVSLVIGLVVNNSFVTIVARSLLVLFLFYLLGCVLSALGQIVVKEHFDRQVRALESQTVAAQDDLSPGEEDKSSAPKTTPAAAV